MKNGVSRLLAKRVLPAALLTGIVAAAATITACSGFNGSSGDAPDTNLTVRTSSGSSSHPSSSGDVYVAELPWKWSLAVDNVAGFASTIVSRQELVPVGSNAYSGAARAQAVEYTTAGTNALIENETQSTGYAM